MLEQENSKENVQNEEMIPEYSELSPMEQIYVELDDLRDKLRYMKWGVFLLGIIAMGSTAILISNLINKEQFVMFNVKETTNNFLNQVSQLDIDEQQKKAIVARYQRNLTDIVNEYRAQGIVVFSTSAILTSVDDKTAEIKSEIAKRMKAKSKKEDISEEFK